jgi:hypothetical protein
MRRREFIALIGGTAAAWPLAVRAQQRERMRRVGVLMNLAADDPEGQTRIVAFVQGLQQSGWTDGRNVWIDTRWAAGDAGRFHRFAEELLALAPDVVFASATPSVQALQQATRTVPIVFANVGDPVGMGLVERGSADFNRPMKKPVCERHYKKPSYFSGGKISCGQTWSMRCSRRKSAKCALFSSLVRFAPIPLVITITSVWSFMSSQ